MFWPEVYIKKELCRRIHSHLGGDYLVWMISGHLLLATLPPKGPMWNQANLKSSTAGVEEWAVLVEHRRSRDQIRAEGWGAASPRKEVIDAEHGTTIWSRSWPVFQVDHTSLKRWIKLQRCGHTRKRRIIRVSRTLFAGTKFVRIQEKPHPSSSLLGKMPRYRRKVLRVSCKLQQNEKFRKRLPKEVKCSRHKLSAKEQKPWYWPEAAQWETSKSQSASETGY